MQGPIAATENSPNIEQNRLMALARERPAEVLSRADDYREREYGETLITEAATRDPVAALKNAEKFSNEKWAGDLLLAAAYNRPEAASENFDKLKDLPIAEQVFVGMARGDQTLAVTNLDKVRDQPWFKKLRNESFHSYLYMNGPADWVAEKVKEDLDDPANSSPRQRLSVLRQHSGWRSDGVERLYQNGVISESEFVLSSHEALRKTRHGSTLLLEAAKRTPNAAAVAAAEDPTLANFLGGKGDQNLDKLAELHSALESHPGMTSEQRRFASYLAPQIFSGKQSIEQVINLAAKATDQQKFTALLAQYDTDMNLHDRKLMEPELTNRALQIGDRINDLHDERDPNIRFAGIRDMSARSLFGLITYGEAEMYTSTYNGVMDRLLQASKTENGSLDRIIQSESPEAGMRLMRSAAAYDRLSELFANVSPESRSSLIRSAVAQIDKRDNAAMHGAISAEILNGNLGDSERAEFGRVIEAEYQRVSAEKSKSGKLLYELLGAQLVASGHTFESQEFQRAAEESAQRRPLHSNTLQQSSLLAADGVSYQRYYFYGDSDGEASFNNMLATYQRDKNWRVREHASYVEISNVGPGTPVRIFANRPQQEEEGNRELKQLLDERGIAPKVVVHRGHSYHLPATLESGDRSAALFFAGSCGGYTAIGEILETSPNAQILSTRGTGTMHINDPVLKSMNEEIRQGRDIDWRTFWPKMEGRFGSNENFGDYIPPHQNAGVEFIRTYRNRLDEMTWQEAQLRTLVFPR